MAAAWVGLTSTSIAPGFSASAEEDLDALAGHSLFAQQSALTRDAIVENLKQHATSRQPTRPLCMLAVRDSN